MSIGWIPCISPILASILFLSGTSGSALQGGGYMLIYITGFAVPFLIITIFSDYFLTKIRKIHPYLPLIKKIGGALLIFFLLIKSLNGVLVAAGDTKSLRNWLFAGLFINLGFCFFYVEIGRAHV